MAKNQNKDLVDSALETAVKTAAKNYVDKIMSEESLTKNSKLIDTRKPDKDKIEILEITIEEMRRVHDWLDQAYVRMKSRIITYLGGGLVALTFLYSGGDTFIPPQVYGKIFYFVGLGLVLGALIVLFIALLPRHWEFSIEDTDLEELSFVTKRDYVEYVKNRYMTSYKMNLNTYESNHKLLNRGFFPLIIGAIILTVLKIFGT